MTVGTYDQAPYDQALYAGGVITAPEIPVEPPPPPPGRPWLTDRIEWWKPGDPSPQVMWDHRDRAPGAFLGMAIARLSGHKEISRRAHDTSAPGQYGATPTGMEWLPRVVSVEVFVHGDGLEDIRQRVKELARSLAVPPPVLAEPPALGRLRFFRVGLPDIEIPAMPTGDSPREMAQLNPRMHRYGMDFYCPQPLYRSIQARQVRLDAQLGGHHVFDDSATVGGVFGGYWFDDSPFWEEGSAPTADVDTDGDVPSPADVEFVGPLPGAVLTNELTGAPIVLREDLADGERLIIATGLGRVRARLFTGGQWVDGWDVVDSLQSDLTRWLIRDGAQPQQLRLSTSATATGEAFVTWRDLHASA